jgi:hypothetical protein
MPSCMRPYVPCWRADPLTLSCVAIIPFPAEYNLWTPWDYKWSQLFLQKLTVAQLLQTRSANYANRRFTEPAECSSWLPPELGLLQSSAVHHKSQGCRSYIELGPLRQNNPPKSFKLTARNPGDGAHYSLHWIAHSNHFFLFPPEQYSYANSHFLHKSDAQKRIAARNSLKPQGERVGKREKRKGKGKQWDFLNFKGVKTGKFVPVA